MRHALLAVLLLAPGNAVLAAGGDELPRYDPAAYCREVADFAGGANSLYNSCIGMEQNAYDDLSRAWSDIPQVTRGYCDEVATFAGGAYSLLESCITMELRAAEETPEFRF